MLNICEVDKRIRDVTGVDFDIVGFDTGLGMPLAKDFRDHPEKLLSGLSYTGKPGRLLKFSYRGAA